MKFRSFDDFWLYYLREHGDAANRALHVSGTAVGIAMAVFGLARRRPGLLLLALLIGYAPAWIGHYFIERNRPASFHNPLWSVRADLRMLALTASGRLGRELQRAQRP